MKPIVDGAAAGAVDLTIGETKSMTTDGEILVVVFNDPSLTMENTIVLLFGRMNAFSETNEISIGRPIDKVGAPLFDMSVGITFGSQIDNPSSELATQTNRIFINGSPRDVFRRRSRRW